jgi:hypothetical protein
VSSNAWPHWEHALAGLVGAPDADPMPTAVASVAKALLSSSGADGPVPSVTVRGASGRWLVLHASRVAGRTDECIAVVIAPATTRAELQPMLAAGYGLTPREAGVLSCLLRGLATKTIAADLDITARPHQVDLCQDRRGTRGQLMATVFRDIHRPAAGG